MGLVYFDSDTTSIAESDDKHRAESQGMQHGEISFSGWEGLFLRPGAVKDEASGMCGMLLTVWPPL